MIATCSYYKIQIIYEYRHTEMVILFYHNNDTSLSRMAYGLDTEIEDMRTRGNVGETK